MNATTENFQKTSPAITSLPDSPEAETRTASLNPPAVKVWLVDDNDQFRTLVADLLGRDQGIECARQFSSPDELLSALASKSGPDVILLDIEMGGQNGLDAVRPIKSLTRSTRVLMFTTCFDPESYQRALSDGASDYLLKSQPLETLIERIRNPGEAADSASRQRRTSVIRRITPRIEPAAEKARRGVPRPLTRTLQILRSFWN